MAEQDHDRASQHTALFLLKEDNVVRKKSKAVVEWTPFEYVILLVIIANCIIIGIGLYLPEEDETAQKLEQTEIYFFIIFVIEMILKVCAYGFVLHPGSYLRNPWNLLDFFVIVVGALSLFNLGLDLNVLRMLRAFRLLRLLRFIKLLRKKN